jgi:hypothetical protein
VGTDSVSGPRPDPVGIKIKEDTGIGSPPCSQEDCCDRVETHRQRKGKQGRENSLRCEKSRKTF